MMIHYLAFLVAQTVLNLGREDPLEKGIATYASIFAWRIPWAEEPGRATVHGVTKSQTQWSANTHTNGSGIS